MTKAGIRLKSLLARITYKNGWDVFVYPAYSDWGLMHEDDAMVLSVQHREPNIERPKDVVVLVMNEPLSSRQVDRMSDAEIIAFVFHCVTKAEIHEMEEWFKVDGVCFRDPHPEVEFPPMFGGPPVQ